MVDVLAGVELDPLMTELDQFAPFPEGHDLLGTRFHTSRRTAELEPGVVTHDAFLDHRVDRAGITVGRNVERTGDHACPAAYAYFRIIDNGPFLGLGIGIDETGGQTGRLITVIALELSENGA